jgi:hypothetical protein
MALGGVAILTIAFAALRVIFARVLGPLLGVIVLSAMLGLLAWNWTIDNRHELLHELGHAASDGRAGVIPLVAWLLPALVVGLMALRLPKRFGGAPRASLRDALQRGHGPS